MKFPAPLVPGRLVRRYKRFLADVVLDGDGLGGDGLGGDGLGGGGLGGGAVVTAHCANPGSMIGVVDPGLRVWLSRNTNPKAKLDWRWELVHAQGTMIGLNTGLANRIAEEAVAAGLVPALAGYSSLRREVRYGRNSRIDLLLESEGRPPCYVEVKNVHMRRPDGPHPTAAEFPDAVTARGAKHLEELGEMVEAGARAVMLYVVQRADCDRFRVAADIDPAYMIGLTRARERGVEAIAFCCKVGTDGIQLDRFLPVAQDSPARGQAAAAPATAVSGTTASGP